MIIPQSKAESRQISAEWFPVGKNIEEAFGSDNS